MILTKEERLRILDAPDRHSHAGIRDRAILELLGGAGLKVRELAALRIENIDLQISCILLPGGAQRMIPFGSRTRESLMNYLYDVRGEVEGPGSLLFPGRGGEQLTRQAVWKIVRKYALSAGIGRGVSPEFLCSEEGLTRQLCSHFWVYAGPPCRNIMTARAAEIKFVTKKAHIFQKY